MRELVWSRMRPLERENLFAPAPGNDAARAAAIEIVDAIRREGDAAVIEYARRLDGFSGAGFRVEPETFEAAASRIADADLEAIKRSIDAVRRFHEKQGFKPVNIETWPGVQCERRVDPIDSCGLYVPAGSAPLVSTLIMLAVPAQLAGVPEIVVAVPPGPDGQVNAAVLAAAKLLGIESVFAIGGAQAIAALAFGAAGLPKVAKIFGPGNAWVAAAKAYVATLPGGPAIDLPAGPSEVMVIADETANPAFVVADLLAQAEHDPMARVSLVSIGANVGEIRREIDHQLAGLPRSRIAKPAINAGVIIEAGDCGEAIEIANLACPEHLIIQTTNPRDIGNAVQTAGAIFLGPWTPESMGDYAAGPNHTLPTGGAGRAWSGVTVEAFQRTTTLVEASPSGARTIAPTVEALAALEGLDGHAAAMRLRREAENG